MKHPFSLSGNAHDKKAKTKSSKKLTSLSESEAERVSGGIKLTSLAMHEEGGGGQITSLAAHEEGGGNPGGGNPGGGGAVTFALFECGGCLPLFNWPW